MRLIAKLLKLVLNQTLNKMVKCTMLQKEYKHIWCLFLIDRKKNETYSGTLNSY